MRSPLADFLQCLEKRAAHFDTSDYYLWPRTPIGEEIQHKIKERIGVSDYDIDVPTSRPAMIIEFLQDLIAGGRFSPESSVLDIACGDAVVLWQIKKAMPDIRAFGIDCNKGKFGTHAEVRESDVALYNVYIQHLFAEQAPERFDVVLMLNTYRGWESADLRSHESNLPAMADAWFARNSRITVLTATRQQIQRLKEARFTVQHIGRGEDDSAMIGIVPAP